MKLYAAYIKEREGLEMSFDDHCFITYKLDSGDVIIYDIYSDKEVRGTGHMLKFCDEFFKHLSNKGVESAYGFTDESTNGWEYSDKLLKTYGFNFIGKNPENTNMNNYFMKLKIGE
jgi:L-amino acid N-acyltransferase YncA|tara:strand:- start:311 stop:658 length:348 start_codon:yes stop_codon:yes gene_type:complete